MVLATHLTFAHVAAKRKAFAFVFSPFEHSFRHFRLVLPTIDKRCNYHQAKTQQQQNYNMPLPLVTRAVRNLQSFHELRRVNFNLFTPEHFPKFLGLTALAGLTSGFFYKDIARKQEVSFLVAFASAGVQSAMLRNAQSCSF